MPPLSGEPYNPGIAKGMRRGLTVTQTGATKVGGSTPPLATTGPDRGGVHLRVTSHAWSRRSRRRRQSGRERSRCADRRPRRHVRFVGLWPLLQVRPGPGELRRERRRRRGHLSSRASRPRADDRVHARGRQPPPRFKRRSGPGSERLAHRFRAHPPPRDQSLAHQAETGSSVRTPYWAPSQNFSRYSSPPESAPSTWTSRCSQWTTPRRRTSG